MSPSKITQAKMIVAPPPKKPQDRKRLHDYHERQELYERNGPLYG